MKKRYMSLFVVLLLVMLVACTSKKTPDSAQSGNSTETQTQTSSAETPQPSEPPVELTMMMQSHPTFPFNKDWLIWDLMGKKANVTLKPTPISGLWWETIPLIVASGDMPDILWMSGADFSHKFGNDGALVNLLDHLDKMPNLSKWMEKFPDESKVSRSADGKLYLSPAEGGQINKLSSFFAYREDIFQKNNLTMPKDYDEFYTLLKKLKEIYPDSAPWLTQYGLATIHYMTASFDTAYDYYFNAANNEWRYGPAEDSFKQIITILNKFYKEKLIPTDFLTMDEKAAVDYITNGKTFIFNAYINNIDTYQNAVRPTNPEFKLGAMDPPAGPNGTKLYGGAYISTEGLTITSTTKHLDAALRFIDSLYTEEEREAVSWGKEGETFEKADGKNQFIVQNKDITSIGKEYGIGTPGTNIWLDGDATLSLMSAETQKVANDAFRFIGKGTVLPPLTKEETDAISIKKQAIGKYVDENLSKFIVGNKSMDQWDKYVAGLKNLGVDDVLNTYKTADARSQSQK